MKSWWLEYDFFHAAAELYFNIFCCAEDSKLQTFVSLSGFVEMRSFRGSPQGFRFYAFFRMGYCRSLFRFEKQPEIDNIVETRNRNMLHICVAVLVLSSD